MRIISLLESAQTTIPDSTGLINWQQLVSTALGTVLGGALVLCGYLYNHKLSVRRQRNARLLNYYLRFFARLARQMENSENRHWKGAYRPTEEPAATEQNQNLIALHKRGLFINVRIRQSIMQLRLLEPDSEIQSRLSRLEQLSADLLLPGAPWGTEVARQQGEKYRNSVEQLNEELRKLADMVRHRWLTE
jgi:hypothetical protein